MNQVGFKKKGQIEKFKQRAKQENKQEVQVQKKFYEMPWFWVCITMIVMCLTKSNKIIICGNANDSGHGNSFHDIANKQDK